jgi:putative ABC transport system permease protein
LNLAEAVLLGWLEISTHRVRSALTLLGIVLGVAAVIAIVAIGNGARAEAVNQLSALGENSIILRPLPAEGTKTTSATVGSGGLSVSQQAAPGFVSSDLQALENLRPTVAALSPVIVRENQTAYFAGSRFTVNLVGVSDEYAAATEYPVALGRFFTREEADTPKPYCVLGATAKFKLFGPLNPVGKPVRILNFICTVIGVMAAKDVTQVTLVQLRDVEKDIYVPFKVILRWGGYNPKIAVNEAVVRITNGIDLEASAELIRARLSRLHGGADVVETLIPMVLLRQKQAVQRIFSLVMGFIAAISLIVGGIGIMNIMLATVLQRTREIGVRRSVGATRRDILLQFLIETIVLCVIGAVFGIMVGFLLAKAITLYAGWATLFSGGVILLAFVVAVAVGVIFGLYPASQAARLHPVEALRYE